MLRERSVPQSSEDCGPFFWAQKILLGAGRGADLGGKGGMKSGMARCAMDGRAVAAEPSTELRRQPGHPKSGYTGSCKTPRRSLLIWGRGGRRRRGEEKREERREVREERLERLAC